MALKSKTQKNLANAMGSSLLSADLEAAIAANATLTAKQKRNLAIALADRKAALDIAQAIDDSPGAVSARSKYVIEDMMISAAEAQDLEDEIES